MAARVPVEETINVIRVVCKLIKKNIKIYRVLSAAVKKDNFLQHTETDNDALDEYLVIKKTPIGCHFKRLKALCGYTRTTAVSRSSLLGLSVSVLFNLLFAGDLFHIF